MAIQKGNSLPRGTKLATTSKKTSIASQEYQATYFNKQAYFHPDNGTINENRTCSHQVYSANTKYFLAHITG